MQSKWPSNFLYVIAGSFLFGMAVNIFVVPMHVYNGGIIGIAQIIRTLLTEIFQLEFNFDIAGIINFLLNIPLFLIAYKSISKKFFVLTLLSIIVQTITFSIVPIPEKAILKDPLTSMIIAGLIGGYGTGLCLKAGGSGAGADILGVFFAMRSKTFTVGRLSIVINALVYTYCAFAFSFSNAIYSIIYAVVFALAMDKIHTQNIIVKAMVITKHQEVKQKVLTELGRGVTSWQGMGVYTNEETDVFITILSKYEVSKLKQCVLALDPNAFIILSEGNEIVGNYEKRF